MTGQQPETTDDADAVLEAYEEQLLAGITAGRGATLRKMNVHQIDIDLAVSPEEAVSRARDVLGADSDLPQPPCGHDQARLVGIIGSGWQSLNPAVVTVTISGAESRPRSRVSVRGTAAEGLIKQRAGEQAARHIAAAMGRPAE